MEKSKRIVLMIAVVLGPLVLVPFQNCSGYKGGGYPGGPDDAGYINSVIMAESQRLGIDPKYFASATEIQFDDAIVLTNQLQVDPATGNLVLVAPTPPPNRSGVQSVTINQSWSGSVPIQFDPSVPNDVRECLRAACAAWGVSCTCRGSERDYVYVGATGGRNSSNVGRTGGQQSISIGTNRTSCEHELGHTLGLLHEQQHPRRDEFIIVDPKFLESEPGNFVQYPQAKAGGFDLQSLMLYACDYTRQRQNPADCNFGSNLGRISAGDRAAVGGGGSPDLGSCMTVASSSGTPQPQNGLGYDTESVLINGAAPAPVPPSSSVTVSFVLRNTGEAWGTDVQFELIDFPASLPAPSVTSAAVTGRVELGQTFEAQFQIQMPATPASFEIKGQMKKAGRAFAQTPASVVILVAGADPGNAPRSFGVFLNINSNLSVAPGGGLDIPVRGTNTGAAWSTAQLHYYMRDLNNNPIPGANEAQLELGAVASNGSFSAAAPITAPGSASDGFTVVFYVVVNGRSIGPGQHGLPIKVSLAGSAEPERSGTPSPNTNSNTGARPTCGTLAGPRAQSFPAGTTCAQRGMVDAGRASDVPVCCRPADAPPPPAPTPQNNPQCVGPHYGMKNGQCVPSCGQRGGTAAFADPCVNHGMNDVGVAYDAPYCCAAGGSSNGSTPGRGSVSCSGYNSRAACEEANGVSCSRNSNGRWKAEGC